MLLSVFSIPSPPPIGTTVGSMAAAVNCRAPTSSATLISMAIVSAMAVNAPVSLATLTGFKATATLNIGVVTSTHS